jgi:hypothetical protein
MPFIVLKTGLLGEVARIIHQQGEACHQHFVAIAVTAIQSLIDECAGADRPPSRDW